MFKYASLISKNSSNQRRLDALIEISKKKALTRENEC